MHIIAIDTETTGLSAGSRLLSLAAIAYDIEADQVIDRQEWLINPGMPVPPDVTPVNGYTTDTVKDGVPASQALPELFAWLPPRPTLVAHNAPYDMGILNWECGRTQTPMPDGIQVIDTLQIAKTLKESKGNKLDALIERYGIQRIGEGHRAMSDADACLQYLVLMTKSGVKYESRPLVCDYHYIEMPDIAGAVEAGGKISFAYEDKGGESSERTITPYGWCARGDIAYVHGWCHLREDRREFRADRMRAITHA